MAIFSVALLQTVSTIAKHDINMQHLSILTAPGDDGGRDKCSQQSMMTTA